MRAPIETQAPQQGGLPEFHLPALPGLLDELFAWLNANLPVDSRKPLAPQDVAHVSLVPAEFAQIPGESGWCAHRRVTFKRVHGIEFWLTQLQLPALRSVADLRGRIAWKLTGNTAALFR
ncbi:hypothetical protein WJ97_11505 [Burkholderia ubonensis]|uniref:hypothetical protein n=1 Tax=Burkholderia ubonensis TaxID=101571 RepID=UPI00075649F4|nr:hypothetical protein [Burkholderia ubonensis]KVP96506.1 hypothetical protein WJ97_11505 [Burkholderia ubonensis]